MADQASSPSSSILACHVCSIGKDSMKDPVVTYCGHLFCWGCLLGKVPEGGLRPDCVWLPCPVCECQLVGSWTNMGNNTIIPLSGNHESVNYEQSQSFKPLPLAKIIPVATLNAKVKRFFELRREIRSSETTFNSIMKDTETVLDSVDNCIEQKLNDLRLKWSSKKKSLSMWHGFSELFMPKLHLSNWVDKWVLIAGSEGICARERLKIWRVVGILDELLMTVCCLCWYLVLYNCFQRFMLWILRGYW